MSKCTKPVNGQTEPEHDNNALSNSISDVDTNTNYVGQTGEKVTLETQKSNVVESSSASDSIILGDDSITKNSFEPNTKKKGWLKRPNSFPSPPSFCRNENSSDISTVNEKTSIKKKLKNLQSKYSSVTSASTNGSISEVNTENFKDEPSSTLHDASVNEDISEGRIVSTIYLDALIDGTRMGTSVLD